jgi:hypothetical protein
MLLTKLSQTRIALGLQNLKELLGTLEARKSANCKKRMLNIDASLVYVLRIRGNLF